MASAPLHPYSTSLLCGYRRSVDPATAACTLSLKTFVQRSEELPEKSGGWE